VITPDWWTDDARYIGDSCLHFTPIAHFSTLICIFATNTPTGVRRGYVNQLWDTGGTLAGKKPAKAGTHQNDIMRVTD